MKSKLSSSFNETIMKTFKSFDKDGNGYISKQELKTAMKKIDKNISNEEIDAMLTEADSNNDGKIDFEGILNSFFWLNEK